MTAGRLDLDAVQAFVRIAELGSFTRASEAMRTTQGAVSLKLKRLEERLGCPTHREDAPARAAFSARRRFPRPRPRTPRGTRSRALRVYRNPAAPYRRH